VFFLLTELQDNLKAQQACKTLLDAELLQKSLNAIAASEDVLVEEPKLLSMEEVILAPTRSSHYLGFQYCYKEPSNV